ncbi:MAG: M55 family metallopeptidase [Clostridia bacterium]|nr:M55 family metallopeptidase [Clostridia bacterium]MBQ4158177.1 M55 family metallopeptidase [Clostridia bacterium]
MKIFIAVDMEGISGINCPDYVLSTGKLYSAGQRLMTEDANAAVRGAFDAGADEVIVADVHGGSGNILVEQLDPRALLLAGSPYKPRFPFLDESVNGMFLLGYHAMAGTLYANLEHTMTSAVWHKFCVNGKAYGELGIDAEISAECGVPVIMASGDDKLCKEAAAWLPGVETAMVKQGLGRQSALCLSPERGRRIVYEKAKAAVTRLINGEKFYFPETPSPAVVQITYKHVPDADAASLHGTKRLDGYTVESVYRRLSDLYSGLWKEYGAEQLI